MTIKLKPGWLMSKQRKIWLEIDLKLMQTKAECKIKEQEKERERAIEREI
jgi:hypothetical protein